MNYKDDIKAIVFDYDGTLIDFNYHASEYTKKALELLKDKDYKICLSSGRPCYLSKKAFIDSFGEYPLDYIFGCNGAEFEDLTKNEFTLLSSLKASEVSKLAKLLDNDLLVLCIYNGEEFLVNKLVNDKELLDWMNARWLRPVLFDFETNSENRSKVLALNKKVDRFKEIEIIDSIKDELSDFNYAFSSNNCLEFIPKDVSKAKCIDKLCELLNCDHSQILSFGDMPNDMPMLLNSTGVIMGNASDDLKAKINLHTSRVDEEGIYKFLSKNGLI